jgi:hypothetical protein
VKRVWNCKYAIDSVIKISKLRGTLKDGLRSGPLFKKKR